MQVREFPDRAKMFAGQLGMLMVAASVTEVLLTD